jgi:hypothetical protein
MRETLDSMAGHSAVAAERIFHWMNSFGKGQMKNLEPESLDGEVNPNHPMTKFARSQWHKVCALLMQKMEAEHKIPGLSDYQVEITLKEIERLSERNMCVVIQERGERLFIRLMPMAEGEKLAREQRGMPA